MVWRTRPEFDSLILHQIFNPHLIREGFLFHGYLLRMKYIINESQLEYLMEGKLANFFSKKPKIDLSYHEGEISDRFKRIIFNRITEILSDTESFKCSEAGVWIIDKQRNDWYFISRYDGFTFYNKDYFKNVFSLFSMSPEKSYLLLREYAKEVLHFKFVHFVGESRNYITNNITNDIIKVRRHCRRIQP